MYNENIVYAQEEEIEMKKIAFVILMCLLTGCSNNHSVVTESVVQSSERLPEDYVVKREMALDFEFGERTGIYTGEIKEGLPDGYGSFSSKNENGEGWVYYGEWKNGHFHGNGISQWDSGAKYVGEYANDLMNGRGAYWEDDGTVQCGKFRNNEFVDEEDSAYINIGFGGIKFTVPGSWEMRQDEVGEMIFSSTAGTRFSISSSTIEEKDILKRINESLETTGVENVESNQGIFKNGITYYVGRGTKKNSDTGIGLKTSLYGFNYRGITYLLVFVAPDTIYHLYEDTFNEVFSSIEFKEST